VIVEFSDVASSMRARSSLHGRKFGGKPVVATYMSEERHMAGDFDEDGHSGGGDLPGPPPM
jgi:splicing factor U2AF subunit